jgi:hypothetical protein
LGFWQRLETDLRLALTPVDPLCSSFFFNTDDFWQDYKLYNQRGIVFVRPPKDESFGMVAVFKDLYGNLWDLVKPKQNENATDI